ncbi:MAG: NAD(P)/FAD-dependent oxidoreductase [Myxococcota bacterium]
MRRIVVLGCGFGGYHAIRELERSLEGRRRVQLTVVTNRSHFLYTPLLPNVVTGEVDLTHITFPLRGAFHDTTEVIHEHVESIDLDARVLRGEDRDIAYDYLLLATGAQTDWAGHTEWRDHALTCKDARDATHLREHISDLLERAAATDSAEERERLMTFVVAGAGPTGTELAAEIYTTLKYDVLEQARPELRDALRFVIVDPSDSLLPDLPEAVRHRAADYLEQIGVELELGVSVSDRSRAVVELSDGRQIETENFFWCGGVRSPEVISDGDFVFDRLGRVVVNSGFAVRGHSGVFAIGDCAGVDPAIPQTAQVATQQGPQAAKNILATLDGRAPRSWSYFHKGDLITLGRRNAIASLRGAVVEGRAAWALYRMAYTALMPTGFKKASLLTNWLSSNFAPGGSRDVAESWRRAVREAERRRLEAQ